MSLSQEQKKFLNEISYNPKHCLNILKTNPSYINSFKEQYLKDGTGILQVIVNGYIHEPTQYEELFLYILENSNLSIFDKKINHDSAIDIFKYHYSNYFKKLIPPTDIFIEQYKQILLAEFKYKKINEFTYTEALELFIKNQKKDEYFELLNASKQSELSIYEHLLQTVIEIDSIEILESLFNKYPNIKNNLIYKGFHNQKNYKEHSNMLIYALRLRSKKISNYFLDNFNFNLYGKILINNDYDIYTKRYNVLGHQEKIATTAISQAFHSDMIDEYKKIIQTLSLDETIEQFSKIETINSSQQYNQLNLISKHKNSEYFNLYINKISLINSCTLDIKIQFVRSVLNSKINIFQIKDLLSTLDMKEINQYLNENTFTSISFFKIFFEELLTTDLTNKEVNIICDIISKFGKLPNLYFHCLFTSDILFQPELLKNLTNNNLIKLDDIEISRNIYANLFHHMITSHSTIISKSNKFELIHETLQFIYDQTKHQLNNKLQPNTFIYILKNQLLIPLEIIKNTDIIQYNLLDNKEFSHIKNMEKEFFQKATSRLLELNCDPFINTEYDINISENKNYPFYQFINNDISKNDIINVLNKYNKNLESLSSNTHFWLFLDGKKEHLELVKELGGIFNTENLSYILRKNNYEYTINYLNISSLFIDSETLLSTIKNKYYESSKALIDYQPSLVITKNKNYPINYLANHLNSEIKKNPKFQLSLNGKNIYDLIILHLKTASKLKDSKTIKSFLKHLNKFELIKEKEPNLYTEISYYLLNSQIKEKEKYTIKKI